MDAVIICIGCRKRYSGKESLLEHRGPYCNGRRKDEAKKKLKSLPGSRPL